MAHLNSTIFQPIKRAKPTSLGIAGYDNPRENVDPHIKTKVVDTKELVVDGTAYVGGGGDPLLVMTEDATHILLTYNGTKLFRIVKATSQIEIQASIDTDVTL